MVTEKTLRVTVPDDWHGCRTDQGLRLLVPQSSLRQRQRWCAAHRVRQDGRALQKGNRLEAGATLELCPELPAQPASRAMPSVRIVSVVNALAALYKPGCVHCEAQAKNAEPSVESMLPSLFPKHQPQLLNRLDYLTSGLVLVGLDQGACDQYRSWQEQGRVQKTYWAEVHGHWVGPALLPWRIEAAKRRKVAVQSQSDPDPLRWTHVRVLRHISAEYTRLEVVIAKGRRHQIRAHLAAAGHPICGDPLYSNDSWSQRLFLHHLRVHLPGFTAETPPPWGGFDSNAPPANRDADGG